MERAEAEAVLRDELRALGANEHDLDVAETATLYKVTHLTLLHKY
jgi:hypothetical protein